MNSRITLIIIAISILLTIPLLAQEEEQDLASRNAFVFTGQGLFSVELAHSIDGYKLGWVGVGFERMMSSWWSLRLDAIPIIVAQKDDVNNDGYGGLITWTGYFGNNSSLTPYANFSAGVAYFEEDIPVANSSRFNFLLSMGGGLDIPVSAGSSFMIGYQFGHLSNSSVGERNPAINGHLVTVGFRKSF